MSKCNGPRFSPSFVGLAAAIPRAIDVLVYHCSSAAVGLDCSIRGSIRIERVLSVWILIDRNWTIDICTVTIFIETILKIVRLTELWRVARQQSKRLALLHFIWSLMIQMMAPRVVHRILEIRNGCYAWADVVGGWWGIVCLGKLRARFAIVGW